MSFPKFLAIAAGILFSIIAITALMKGGKSSAPSTGEALRAPLEVELDQEIRMVTAPAPSMPNETPAATPIIAAIPPSSASPASSTSPAAGPTVKNITAAAVVPVARNDTALPDADRIDQLFNKGDDKLPIVQTIIYKSRVPWQKGRPAWLSDYAAHYSTSRHFIARSLNGKADYFKQDIAEGDRFNVLHPDKNISFYLLIDTSRSKMWFYYLDLDTNERVLLKTYQVGLGRIDSSKPSGMLTPLGKYSLGNKIAIYKPKATGFHGGQKVEMIRVFGTRWIPFEKELGNNTAPADGFGLHGVPWILGSNGELVENIGSLGKYESDGCIRLSTKDIEELFAIIITRPSTIELVKDFYEAKQPAAEKGL